MKFQYDDGGREASGYKGKAGDCFVRAVSIAAQLPYQETYDLVNKVAKYDEDGSARICGKRSNSRLGVYNLTSREVMRQLGWAWIPTMQIGSGCRVHLRSDELPSGRLVLRLSGHFAAVVDGVLRDTSDCSREGSRCVYGYWSKA